MSLALFALLCLGPGEAHSSDLGDRIVSPASGGVVAAGPGDELAATVALRLPLTPPPGVQQPKIWEGWSVILSREVDRAAATAPKRLEYPCRILRIRPAEGGVYRITSRIPPWVPEAVYDLGISGPGFEDRASSSVRVLVEKVEKGDRCVITVTIPADWPAASVSLEGAEISPVQVSWAGAFPETGKGPRVLVFDGAEAGGCGSAGGSLEIRVAKPTPRAEPRISVSPWEGALDPVRWYALFIEGGDPALEAGIVWDFGDGEWGAGRRVMHRWMFAEEARVKAFAFGRRGDVRGVARRFEVARPLARDGGCGCGEVGGRVGRKAGRERATARLFQIILSVFGSAE